MINWEKEANTEDLKELPLEIVHVTRVGFLNVIDFHNM